MSTKISVVIPTYNREKTICRAIDSVLAQEMPDTEIIVVDDGSTDATLSVLSKYGKIITLIHQVNHGVSYARSVGIAAAKGEFVAFLDSDDEWYSGKLRQQLFLLESRPDLCFVSTGAEYVDDNGIVQQKLSVNLKGNIISTLLYRNVVVASSVLARKENLLSLQPIFCDKYSPAEDWHLWLRLASRFNVIIMPDVFVRYQLSNNGLTRTTSAEKFRKLHKLIYSDLLHDSSLGPTIKREWQHLQANIHFKVAYYLYEKGSMQMARAEMIKAILTSPFKIRWQSAFPILALPLGLRNILRKVILS